jgi:hypothetical protein
MKTSVIERKFDEREFEVALISRHSAEILHGLLTGDWSLVDAIPEPHSEGTESHNGSLRQNGAHLAAA